MLLYPVNIVLKCSEMYLKCLKQLGFRGTAPDPTGGATAYPRPPTYRLAPLALGI